MGDANASHARPLRVLLFSTLYPSAARPGHGSFVETRLAKLLDAGGVDARVIAPVPWFPSSHPRFGTWATMARTPRREARLDIDVRHPRYVLPPRVGETIAPMMLALGAWPSFRNLPGEGFDPDVIDAHYAYPDGVAAALLAVWANKPLVITARGSDLFVLGGHALPRRMMRWAFGRAAAAAGVCQALVDVLAGWGLPTGKLHVLTNGVDLQRFSPVTRGEARRLSGVRGTPALLCVGNLVPIKGQALALDALARLLPQRPGATLTLVGDGSDEGDLRRRTAALGLADRVRFAGRVAQEELRIWYSAADLLLLPSYSEGWANVLLEAMACGTPVVSTDVGGSREVVADAVAGALLGGRDPDAFAALIVEVLSRHGSRDAVRAYASSFSWTRTAEAHRRVLCEAVARAHTPNVVPARSHGARR